MAVIDKIQAGSNLFDIQDSNAIANPSSKTDGQILTYDATNDKWIAQTAQSTAAEHTFTFASNSTASQTFTITGVTANTIGSIAVAQSATQEQYQAATKAQLRCTAQSANSITVTAYGTTPTVSGGIPCVLTVLKY